MKHVYTGLTGKYLSLLYENICYLVNILCSMIWCFAAQFLVKGECNSVNLSMNTKQRCLTNIFAMFHLTISLPSKLHT